MSEFSLIERLWYQKNPWCWLLYPCSVLYRVVASLRRWYLQTFQAMPAQIPTIVVGNISVGGVGKTPLVVATVEFLQSKGFRVAVISRGYKAKIQTFPHLVRPEDDPIQVGDEPSMLCRRLQCPVVIDPKRCRAVQYLQKMGDYDVLVLDDGMQHYRLGRTMEIAVIDGNRGLGNGLCLPAGPLREPPSRLEQVDRVVINQGLWPGADLMRLHVEGCFRVKDDKQVPLADIGKSVLAIAGIGHPQRFFDTLRSLGLKVHCKAYPDHHAFNPADLASDDLPVLMTEKDAIKCRHFANDQCYYLKISAKMEADFWQAILDHVTTLQR